MKNNKEWIRNMCKLAEDSNYDFSSWNTNAHKISQTIWNQQEIKNLKL